MLHADTLKTSLICASEILSSLRTANILLHHKEYASVYHTLHY